MSLLQRIAKLPTKLRYMPTQVAELVARMSLVDGRSLLNAERNVRTHSSLQNLAEDLESVKAELQQVKSELAQIKATETEDQ